MRANAVEKGTKVTCYCPKCKTVYNETLPSDYVNNSINWVRVGNKPRLLRSCDIHSSDYEGRI